MPQIRGYNKTAICPYNRSHLVPLERFQTHLVKCGRNYPNTVLKKCPFNSSHLMKEQELESHVLSCDDRVNYDLYKYQIASGSSSQSSAGKVEEMALPRPTRKLPISDDGEASWDDDVNSGSYDPQAYVRNANVIRTLNLATPSQKKAFREAERIRLQSFHDKK